MPRRDFVFERLRLNKHRARLRNVYMSCCVRSLGRFARVFVFGLLFYFFCCVAWFLYTCGAHCLGFLRFCRLRRFDSRLLGFFLFLRRYGRRLRFLFAGSGAVLRFSNSSSSLLYRSMSETISSLFIICLRWVKFAGRPFCGRAKTSHIQYIAAAPFWSHVRALTHIF